MLLRWDTALTTNETNSVVKGLALTYCAEIQHAPLRAEIQTLLMSEDWLGLCKFDLPYDALTYSDVIIAAQILAFFQKRVDLDLGIDRESVAYEKFKESERLCGETNEVFRLWSSGKFQFSQDVERVFHRAQRKIALCLGDVPSLESLSGRFGPGATTQVKRRDASARRKLSQKFACSEEFLGVLVRVLEELPQWVGLSQDGPDSAVVSVEIHHGLLHFVPKNAKTDRSIVVEPMLNSFIQLGVGDYIARRLRVKGVDITDQTRNQQLARLGSLYGELATLDLSSASDTVARELVAHLLPVDWFLFLDQIRTGSVEYQGTVMRLQKFSSMGNGFTFPLETLIFWALAESAMELTTSGIVSVYGDDIIVPVGTVPLLSSVLTAAGFLLNESKSFWSGPFRESCGKDYHSGILVRPVFLKDRLSGESCYALHNFFMRNLDPDSANVFRELLDPEYILFGPDGYGDGHLISDRPLPSYCERFPDKKKLGWSGFIFDTYTWSSRKCFKALSGDYVYPSYSIYTSERAPHGVPEDAELLAKLGKKLFVAQFGDDRLQSLLSQLKKLSVMKIPVEKRTGSFGVTLPGVRGYKRISIYTLG